MAGGGNFGGKRELLARGLRWSGASFLLGQLPARESLLVLNYHRIGNPEDDLYDPGVFSATADEFYDQIAYVKRHLSLVTLDEALTWIDGSSKEKARRCRVLITFDDGYLDNYQIAYPILRSHGAQGVFFLATKMVGSSELPWWDRIAYLVKSARRRSFTLRYPDELAVDIETNGINASLNHILKFYKRPDNSDPAHFLQELAQEAGGEESPATPRRFLDWTEAREMIAGGMAIGSHTHSHCVLSQLPPESQREELSQSRNILRDKLGIAARALAYPVGGKTSFTAETQDAARQAGYRAAFSFYGGTNLPNGINPYNVNRIGVGGQSMNRFRVQTAICRVSGSYWP